MQTISIAILGYGNIGKAALEAIQASPDFSLCGVIRSNAKEQQPQELQHIPVVSGITDLSGVDVVLICSPSRNAPAYAQQLLEKGIATVDSFDIHTEIPSVQKKLDSIAKEHHSTSILSAGWDPGVDSILRTLMQAMAPSGITYTNFGPGMSMGHSTAAKRLPGIQDALSITIPKGQGLHGRMVYVELEEGANAADAISAIQNDPYFVQDETHVQIVPDIQPLKDSSHGVHIERVGGSGRTHNQQFAYHMRIDNPALTAQVMLCCARAAMRMPSGCHTMIEIPPIYLLPQTENWVQTLV